MRPSFDVTCHGMTIKIVNKSKHALPEFETLMSAGMDLRANLSEGQIISPGERKLIGTGLFLALPQGYEAQIRPRSGQAYKHGISVLNSPGTIDADYRGEIKVLLINHGQEGFKIEDGERIAQMVIAKYERVSFDQVDNLDDTERGAGGFGSTGTN